MSKPMIAVCAASMLALAGCHPSSSAPVKRQPGSWSQKVEIVRLEGKDAPPQAKTQVQAMFDAMSRVSVCVTPEAAAKEDMSKNLENASGSAQNCTFDRKTLSGETVDFAGTCGAGANKVRIEARGTSGATAQDLTMTVQPLGADGKPNGMMEMHMTASRGGACKPGDITPPAEGGAARNAPAQSPPVPGAPAPGVPPAGNAAR